MPSPAPRERGAPRGFTEELIRAFVLTRFERALGRIGLTDAAIANAHAGPTASEPAECRLRRRSASARNGAVENVVTSAMSTIIAKIRGERIPSS